MTPTTAAVPTAVQTGAALRAGTSTAPGTRPPEALKNVQPDRSR